MERQKTKCSKCGQDIYDDMKNCPNCNAKNTNYTYFYLGQQAIKVSKSTFAFLIAIPVFFVMLFVIAGIESKNVTDNNNVDSEKVSVTATDTKHKWTEATCEQPSICNECGETKGEALGHTTDCGVCTHCNKEFRKQSPVTISNWTYNIDSAGGVEWNLNITNNTDKQIKYVTLEWNCYNAVGDLIRDEIGWKTYCRVKYTGPLDAHSTSARVCNTRKFYNHTLKSYQLSEVIVEYMDGTTEKVTQYHDNITK